VLEWHEIPSESRPSAVLGVWFITGLKQGDALSPLLFNIALEKIIRNVKNNNLGTNIDVIQIDILGFSDDINLIGDSMEIVEQNTNTLVESVL